MRALDDIRARYAELERARDEIQDLLCNMENIDLPDGIEGSHHASMEWNDALSTIEDEIQRIDDAIEQL